MKISKFVSQLSMTLLVCSYSLASSTNILNNESINNGVVLQTFNLQSQNGEVITFLPDSVKNENNLGNLPPENGADNSLCTKKLDVTLYMKLLDIVIHLTKSIVDDAKPELTENDIALIQKTPRCLQYKETLITIANILSTEKSPDPEKLNSVSLVKTNHGTVIELKTKSNKNVNLLIDHLPEIHKMDDLTRMIVNADSSGQNLGLKIKFDADLRDQFPSVTNSTESCSISYQVKTCDQRGKCYTQTITETGYRNITTTTRFNMVNYSLELVNSQNQAVFHGIISDGDFESTRDTSSPCMRH